MAAIAAGADHTCALTTAGGVVCWGFNFNGALGDGTTTNRWTPTPVSGLGSGVAAVAAGGYHTCALTTAGGVLCWGANGQGALGDGTTTRRLTPTPVSGLGSGVAAVTAGYGHTCALTTGGSALCWGDNQFGQLGDGTTTHRLTPTAVSGPLSGVMAVAAGAYAFFTCAQTAGGGVVCWGDNFNGALGDGTTTSRSVPTQVVGFEGRLAQWGDFTGDLRSDVLWRHASGGDVWLWPLDGATRVSEDYVRTVADINWEIRGTGDQNGNGKADILWRNKATGMIYAWPMNGSTPIDEIYVGTVDPAYDVVGTGDFNGDGQSDILWRHTTLGDVWIWLMDGATRVNEVYVDRVNLAYVVKAVGDLNGDWKADIVWHNATTGEVWAWLMVGTTRVSQTWVANVPDTGTRSRARPTSQVTEERTSSGSTLHAGRCGSGR